MFTFVPVTKRLDTDSVRAGKTILQLNRQQQCLKVELFRLSMGNCCEKSMEMILQQATECDPYEQGYLNLCQEKTICLSFKFPCFFILGHKRIMHPKPETEIVEIFCLSEIIKKSVYIY